MPEPRPQTARAILPNAGITAWYERQLRALVRQMAGATEREIKMVYRAEILAQDEAVRPAPPQPDKLKALLAAIFKRMGQRFDEAARLIAASLAKKVGGYTHKNMAAALKEAGLTVEMNLTAREAALMQNIIRENVDLIKSIPEQYFDRVRAAVGERLGLKYTPEINFEFDRNLEYAQHMTDLLNQIGRQRAETGDHDQ